MTQTLDALNVDAVTTALTVAPTDITTSGSVPTIRATVQQQPAVSTASATHDPVEMAATTLTSLVSSLVSPLAGDNPTAPTDSPATWTLLAAARQEQFGVAPTIETVADPATNGLVVSIPQTPLLAPLQQIPVIGPLLVTPIVALINQIPIVSDVLHPLIGYPLQTNQAPGTPAPRDVKVVSFDGTQIYVHFMPAQGLLAGQQAPTVLYGPGLGMPGATNIDGTVLDGLLADFIGMPSIATLRQAGYNVVTWDPRGEYFSGGQLEIDSPDFEARDVSTIISWVAQQPEAQLDGVGDPRTGMVGASYGGGIQLVTAAIDHRVDAIVPTIAWNTLNTSLYKNDSFKSGWGTLLSGALALTLARTNPRIAPATLYGDLTGMVTPSDQDLLAARGPGGIRGFPDLVKQITAPTLLIQGTVDTLFSLQEADDNAQDLIADHVPTKVLWFCGGHGVCTNNLFDTSDGALIQQRTVEWLDRYVKGDTSVSTGPQFEWVDQTGQYFSSNVYPVTSGNPIVTATSKAGVLPLLPYIGGSGPLFGVVAIGGTKAFNALNLTTPVTTSTSYVVGAPTLTLTYSGTGIGRHVYAQLVDDTTGLVLGNQVTPIPVMLDGQQHTITVSLEPVAHTLRPGQTVTLQLVASAADYQTFWSFGQLEVSSMQLSLPTADAAAISPESVASLTSVA